MKTLLSFKLLVVIILIFGGVFLFSGLAYSAQEGSGFPELDDAIKALNNAQQSYDKLLKSGTATEAQLTTAAQSVKDAQKLADTVKKTKRGASVEGTGTASPGGGGGEEEGQTVETVFAPGPPPGRPPEASPKERPPVHPPHPVQGQPKQADVRTAALNIQLQPHERILDVGGI